MNTIAIPMIINKTLTIFLATLALLITLEGLSQEGTGRLNKAASSQEEPVLIKNAHVYPVSEPDFQEGLLAFEDGTITFVGKAEEFNQDTSGWHIIDAESKKLYPGIIALNTRVGLVEIDRIDATKDYRETGTFNPNVRSKTAYNTESDIIPTTRANGVLLSQVSPSGGLMPGQSSVMAMDGWNWEDATYAPDNGLHLNWPSRISSPGWWGNPEDWEKAEVNEELDKIYDFFEDAYSYHQNPEPDKKNLRLEALEQLFEGEQKLFVRARRPKAIKEAIELANKYDFDLVLKGVREIEPVLDLVRENEAGVIISRTHRNPSRPHDDIDKAYHLPQLLAKADIPFSYSRHHSWRIRNFPFYAGSAVGHGLSKEEALRSITLYPAELLGIDDRTGTLEEGKDANFILSQGDVMDMKSSRIEEAFLKGRQLDLYHHQEQLFDIYMERFDLPYPDN